MERRPVNPWSWQDNFGFSQAIEVSGAQRTIFCAGQTSTDEEGNPVHLNYMRGQINQALGNLETVFGESGTGLSDVVRFNPRSYEGSYVPLFTNFRELLFSAVQ